MAKKFKCNVCGKTFEADTVPEKCPICGAPASEIKEVKKRLNTNSHAYTIAYAAVMVVVVAFLLAFVSSALKPTQDVNVENDTKGQILTAMGFSRDSIDVKTEFDKVRDYVLDSTQTVMTPYEGQFESSYGKAIKEGRLHVFVGKSKNGEEVYVLPVVGRGLWGGLWGYLALSFDSNVPTVKGAYFYHESETAGLGARIADRDFQEQFIGKPIYNESDPTHEIALTVVKKGTASKATEIDGVTGATLTSAGVGAMVNGGLKIYGKFIESKTPALLGNTAAGTGNCAAAVNVEECDNTQNN